VGESVSEGEPQPTAEELAAYIDSRVDMGRVRDELLRLRHQQLARQKFNEMESAQQAALHGSAFIEMDLGGDPPPLTPLSIWVRDDKVGLASAEHHAHLLIGTRSSGKSWLIQYLLLEQARLGRRVAYLDWEMNGPDVQQRLVALGGKPELNKQFKYAPMSGRPIGSQMNELLAWEPDIVLIDSVVRAMGAEDDAPQDHDNSSSFFVSWISKIERLRAHASLFLIDHTGHANPGRARGASAKMDQVDFAYTLDVTIPWSRTTAGSAIMMCRKSRAGELAQDEPCCEVRVTPSRGGEEVDIKLLSPSPGAALIMAGREETAADAECRAKIMALMADGEVRSRTDIRKRKLGGSDRVVTQVNRLIAEGVLEDTGSGFRIAPAHD
jgi:hypothetical protein